MGSYIPSTPAQRQEMLEAIGLHDFRQLYRDVPEEMLLRDGLDLPEGMSELEVSRTMTAMAARNIAYSAILRGAGAYDHYIPSLVKYVPAKEEFLTAYTPYQAEMSQGILQSIFEYQTMICQLTGMDVSNASVYDGATAAAEAAAMCRDRKRRVTLISAAAHPDTINTVRTYCYGTGDELRVVPVKDGRTDPEALRQMLAGGDVSGVYIQQPNFFGQLEEAEALGEIIHQGGALYILGVNPIAAAILKTPRDCGADVAVGEGQPLGMPLGWGGPYLGFMATVQKHMRKLPGRIVGQTKDVDGEIGYVLTLSAREQHIRREKANSNICSNQSLMALYVTIYLSLMGKKGLRQVCDLSYGAAHYLHDRLIETGLFSEAFNRPFLKEFALHTDIPADRLQQALLDGGFFGALPTEEGLVTFCATERRTREEIDRMIDLIKQIQL
ncbi:MAG: aminomethyl-transferring glycine dehydrogenase subunit GcvPA [Porphyromonadaceae bacterium]|nr:aminomethyl-transferring glycine dehydrogenase subunit GcvPA [Porphyromonadaceae bacterium]